MILGFFDVAFVAHIPVKNLFPERKEIRRRVAIKPHVVIVGLIGVAIALAHEPITTKLTWTQEISRIIC